MPGDGSVAVVTGANRGIGREVSAQLARHGYIVVLGLRDLNKGHHAARDLDPTGRLVMACHLDVAEANSVRAMAAWVADALGGCDVLVNNAAIDYDNDQRAVTADFDRVQRALETNLLGAWRTSAALLPLLRRSPHPRIVNVSSEGGSISQMTGGTPAYAVSKAALNALTRLLAGELRGDRILVNAVCPGWTDTDMGQGGRQSSKGPPVSSGPRCLPTTAPPGGFYRDGHALPW